MMHHGHPVQQGEAEGGVRSFNYSKSIYTKYLTLCYMSNRQSVTGVNVSNVSIMRKKPTSSNELINTLFQLHVPSSKHTIELQHTNQETCVNYATHGSS